MLLSRPGTGMGMGTGAQVLCQGVQRTAGCPKSIAAARLAARLTMTCKGTPDCLQRCREPQRREMDIRDLSQSWGCDGGWIPMV